MLLHLMPKPTSPWSAGPPVGAGCSLAASCDLRFASDGCVFATNFSPNGLSGDYGGSLFWTRIVGTSLARQLYFLNEKISARKGPSRWGWSTPSCLQPNSPDYTYEVGRKLVRIPAALLALVKENLNRGGR